MTRPRYLHSDAVDVVSAGYDFLAEEHDDGADGRRRERWAHEYMDETPYGGILVSRAMVGSDTRPGRYTAEQRAAFRAGGARGFLRYPEGRYPGSWLMGDCGSFSYAEGDAAPDVGDTLAFYAEGGFDQGISPDAIVFDFDAGPGRPASRVPDGTLARYESTLSAAVDFLRGARDVPGLTPFGAVQGWSERSLAEAARRLVGMGYGHLAIGGLVPLTLPDIDRALAAVREAAPSAVIHALGFGKPSAMHVLARHGVGSFDTASPMLRAVRDARANYWTVGEDGAFGTVRAVRVPDAANSAVLRDKVRRGEVDPVAVAAGEVAALRALRAYDVGDASLEEAVEATCAYWNILSWRVASGGATRRDVTASLADRAWRRCPCRACRNAGIHVILMRSRATNRRRGFHNAHVLGRFAAAPPVEREDPARRQLAFAFGAEADAGAGDLAWDAA